MSKTITISMSEKDFERINTYCTVHELTRSKFLVQSAIEKVDVCDLVENLQLMTKYYRKVANEELLTDEDREGFELALQMLGKAQNGK